MVSMASRSDSLRRCSHISYPILVVPLAEDRSKLKRRARPIRYADLRCQSRDTGFLVRRGLEVFVCRFSFGCEVERDERVAGDCVGLRFEAAGLAGRVVLCFTGSCSAGFEARLSAASLAARASLRRRLFR